MKEPVLVIMAAGMGSRFGGLKQITPVDREGDKIIDFSLYDAYRAGFRKVVFIIKHSIEEDFKKALHPNLSRFFEISYVFQELNCLPEGYTVPEGRIKPWGTAHAIACAKDAIDGPFAIINADDYYGISSLKQIYDFLSRNHTSKEHCMVGYRLKNTLTENGTVSRGICTCENGYLKNITERTAIAKRKNDAVYSEDQWKTETFLPGETLVSMNMWGFQKEILEEFNNQFAFFLDHEMPKNPLKSEYYLTIIVNSQIASGSTIKVLETDDIWHGVTYSEDLPDIQNAIAEMKQKRIYPKYLWTDSNL